MRQEVFVINLERCKEKAEKMKNRLSDVDFSFIKAVDGKQLTEEKLKEMDIKLCSEWKDPYSGRNLTWGEVGCMMSHYNIYKKCVEENIDVAIILEDDVTIPDNFTDKVNKIITDLNNDIHNWNLCYLGRKSMDDRDIDIHPDFVLSGYSYWTCAYIINLKGMKKILDSGIKQNIIPADEILPILGNVSPYKKYYEYFNITEYLNIYSIKSLICHPEPGAFDKSDTEKSQTIDPVVDDSLLVLATGTDMVDGLKRFIKSCETNGLKYKIMGLGQSWKGGNMAAGPGGGHKVTLLHDTLKTLDDNQIVLVSDSYDVIMCSTASEILRKYKKFNKDIVFASESACWPDSNKANKYPLIINKKNLYLNSGGFIGTVQAIKKIVKTIPGNSDDQGWYTDIFLSDEGKKFIALDYDCQIFQCMNDAEEEIEVVYDESRIRNKKSGSQPCHLHGNGAPDRKRYLDKLENYLMGNWSSTSGYNKTNQLALEELKKLSPIKLAICYHTIDKPVPHYMDNMAKQNINQCIDKVRNSGIEVVLKQYMSEEHLNDKIKNAKDWGAEFTCVIDTNYIVTNENTLLHLMLQNKGIICPLLSKPGMLWSNYWGKITPTGWYEGSEDYRDIVEHRKKGCWNVPHIAGNLLINGDYIEKVQGYFESDYNHYFSIDMKFCHNCRQNDIFMYVDNQEEFGYIFDHEKADNIPETAVHKEFYMFESNRFEWEKKYFDERFRNAINDWKKLPFEEPCKWCFQFPFVNDLFCQHLLDEVNALNAWSVGGDKEIRDDRISNVEAIPTVDIHMKQIGFRKQWEKIIHQYIAKVVSHLFSPFQTKDLNIAFVVKYDMKGQKKLQPHHDSSAYSVNIALNTPGVDFQGGGTRFVKQGVHVQNKKGHAIIHPGRLTHYHEGVPITSGVRYIMVSFVH